MPDPLNPELPEYNSRATTVSVVTFGCSKNLVDAELILGYLGTAGFQLVADPELADAVIVNTCAFLAAAREESLDFLTALQTRKSAEGTPRIIVAGCMVHADRDLIASHGVMVDAYLSPFLLHKTPDAVAAEYSSPITPQYTTPVFAPRSRRLSATPASYAYVKISDGCDNRCGYCRIPHLRGPFRSKPVKDIVGEVESMIRSGVPEIVLISQDTTQYGRDRGSSLSRLIGTLSSLSMPPHQRIRILYMFPSRVDSELLTSMLNSGQVCRYMDLPLQHVSGAVLKRMKRPGDERRIRGLLAMIRRQIPHAAIRTTFITGFPGETDSDFQCMLRLVEEGWFDHAGVFPFSPEPNTPAWRFRRQYDPAMARDRMEILMAAQQEVSRGKNQSRIGTELEVFVDGVSADVPGTSIARSEFQAPEVDGVVILAGEYASGTRCRVSITAAAEYDLTGEVMEVHEQENLPFAGPWSQA